MYISSGITGMATVLQQKQNCMKSLGNGANAAGSIIVAAPTQASVGQQVSAVSVSSNNSTVNGNVLLTAQGQQIILTHGSTAQGNVNVISFQQYQQLLQQGRVQIQTTNTSLHANNASPQLSAGRVYSTVASLSAVASRPQNAAVSTVTSNMNASSFQQQFQQQIAATNSSAQPNKRPLVLKQKQLPQKQQLLKSMPLMSNDAATSSSNNSATTTTGPRYFSQFSQIKQQQAATVQQLPNRSVNNVNISAASANKAPLSTTSLMVARATKNLLPGSLTTTPRYESANWLKRIKNKASTNTTSAAAVTAAHSAPTYSKSTYAAGQQQPEPLAKTHYVPTPAQLQSHHYSLKTLQQLKQIEQAETAARNGVSGQGEAAVVPNGHDLVKTQQSTTSNNNTNVTDSALINSTTEEDPAKADSEPELDIVINNVVCSFSVRCHLNLRDIAQNGFNVEFRRENGMVTMKLRRPYTTASIWSSGRITCTGSTSEHMAKVAARRYARCLQKLGFRVHFQNFRVVNVLGTCSMPWSIKIVNFSARYKSEASYEPELHPGVTYKLKSPKATLKIFSTGSVTVTATCVAHVQAAIEHIYPLLLEFRKERSPAEAEALRLKKLANRNPRSQYFDVDDPRESKDELEDFASFDDGAVAAGAPKRKRRKMNNTSGREDHEEDADDPLTADAYNSIDELMITGEMDVNDLIEGPEDEEDC